MTKKPNLSYNTILLLLAVCLLLAIIGSVTLGRYPIGLKELGGILLSRIRPVEPFWTKTQESLLLQHRLPRILLACLVGGCLSSAGAAYQGVFQNPMAAPDILGASSGAAFGAALAILLRLSGSWIMVLAFLGSIVTVLLVMFVAGRAKGKRVLGLILAGIMVSSLISSGTSLIKLVADPEDQLPAITYWLMGGLNNAAFKTLLLGAPPIILGIVILYLLRWRMNLLPLSEDEVRSSGVNISVLRGITVVCAPMITASCVSMCGQVGWVGLLIPHMCRMKFGSNHLSLLPASISFGAAFLMIVDTVARSASAQEIPISILTAIIGAPFFIILMRKSGGWSL